MRRIGWYIAAVVIALLIRRVIVGRSSPRIVAMKLDEDAQVIDVRTAAECAHGMYPGATNIPLDELSRRTGELGDKERPIVVYCHSGTRSAMARRILLKAGFGDVVNAGRFRRMMSLKQEQP